MPSSPSPSPSPSPDRLQLALDFSRALIDLTKPAHESYIATDTWTRTYSPLIQRAPANVFTESTCAVCGDETKPQSHNGHPVGVTVTVPHDHEVAWRLRVESTHVTSRVVCRSCTASALRLLADEFDPSTVEETRKVEVEVMDRLSAISSDADLDPDLDIDLPDGFQSNPDDA